MCTGAYRGRGVSRLMCTYAVTLCLFLLLFCGVLFYLYNFNLMFIEKGAFVRNGYFCPMRSTEPKLAKTLLILIK